MGYVLAPPVFDFAVLPRVRGEEAYWGILSGPSGFDPREAADPRADGTVPWRGRDGPRGLEMAILACLPPLPAKPDGDAPPAPRASGTTVGPVLVVAADARTAPRATPGRGGAVTGFGAGR